MHNKLALVVVTIIALTTNGLSNGKVIGSKDQYEELTNGLYNSSDKVVVLNATSLKTSIEHGRTAWLVEFYNSWCGYCQRFAPTWKSFAKNVAGWKDIVTVAAIDCSNENNNPVCRDYEIMKYPTIRYFSVGGRGIGVDAEKSMSEEGVRQGLIEKLQKDQQEGKGGNWPNIAPYRSNDPEDWKRALPPSATHHFFLFEDTLSYLGTEVILDFHTVKTVQIRRITKDNEWLCMLYRVTTFPSLIVFDKEGQQNRLKLPEASREGVTRVINDFLKSKNLLPSAPTPSTPYASMESRNEPEVKLPNPLPNPRLRDVLYQADLESALRYSLEREVSQKYKIEGEQLQALKNYIKVLSRYFPLKRGNPGFLSKLDEVLSDRSSITGENFSGLVTLYQQEMAPVFSENREWIGCRGSKSYPCGLWTMFHTLTVNHAEAFEEEDQANRSVGAVLAAMHGYIKNFFGCSDCAEHFVDMAEKRELSKVESVENAILWLWKAHNEVNNRLSKEETGDVQFPKIQYPSKENCPQCRGSEDEWNEREVLGYLKRKYGVSRIHYGLREQGGSVVKRREALGVSAEAYGSATRKIGWDFTVFDISILVVLYAASAAIIVFVCGQFVVKRSRRKVFNGGLMSRA